jgi:hypothetical protein
MDLEARKISFVQEFLRLQNEDIITGLENFLHNRKSELFEKSLKPMSISQFNSEIDQSIAQAESGRVTKASDLKARIKKWN